MTLVGFKHNKEEEGKDYLERTFGTAISSYYNTLQLEIQGLPIMVNLNINYRSFNMLISFLKISDDLFKKLKAYIHIKNDTSKIFHRLEKDNITYLSVGDYNSSYYQIKLTKNVIDLKRFYPIEIFRQVYMMTPSSYHRVKSDVQYTQDKTVTYLKSKDLILEYLSIYDSINNETIRELCRCKKAIYNF